MRVVVAPIVVDGLETVPELLEKNKNNWKFKKESRLFRP